MISRSEHYILHIIKWWQGQQVTLVQSSEHSTVCMLLQVMVRLVQDPGVANRTFYLSHTSSSEGEVCRWPLRCHQNILLFTYFIKWWRSVWATLVQSAFHILHQGKVCMWPWCSHWKFWKFLPLTYFIKASSVCDLGAVIGNFCPSHTSSRQGLYVTLVQSLENSALHILHQVMAKSVGNLSTVCLSHTSSIDGKVCGQPQYSLPFTYFINWWQSVGNLSTVCLSHTSSSDGKVCGWYRYSLPIRYFIKAKYIGDLCAVIRTFYPSHTSSTDGGVCGWPWYSLPFTYFIKVKYVGDLTSVQSALHILHQSELCRWPLCSHRNILPFTYFKWWRSLWATSVQSVLHILHQGEVCMWRQCSHQKVVPFRYICSWWQGELVTEAIWSGMRCVPWNIQRWMLQYFVFVILLSTPFSDEDGIFWSLPQVL